MQCIKSTYHIEEIIKKSRFIGVLIPCTNELAIHKNLQLLSLQYQDASHITYGYRIKTESGFISRFHDAGEPSGTAGKPIFQHIEGKDLINVLLAVIRYFGGTKLGAGGLIRAYGNTAKQVIEGAVLYPYVEYAEISMVLVYNQIQAFEYYLKKLEGKIINQDFSDVIQLRIKLPKNNLSTLIQAYPITDNSNYLSK